MQARSGVGGIDVCSYNSVSGGITDWTDKQSTHAITDSGEVEDGLEQAQKNNRVRKQEGVKKVMTERHDKSKVTHTERKTNDGVLFLFNYSSKPRIGLD